MWAAANLITEIGSCIPFDCNGTDTAKLLAAVSGGGKDTSTHGQGWELQEEVQCVQQACPTQYANAVGAANAAAGGASAPAASLGIPRQIVQIPRETASDLQVGSNGELTKAAVEEVQVAIDIPEKQRRKRTEGGTGAGGFNFNRAAVLDAMAADQAEV